MGIPWDSVELLLETCAGLDVDTEVLTEQAKASVVNNAAGISLQSFIDLVLTAQQLCQDEPLGLRLGQRLNFMRHGIVGAAALASANVKESLDTLVRYASQSHAPFIDLKTELCGDEIRITFAAIPQAQVIERFIIDGAMSSTFTMAALLSGTRKTHGILRGELSIPQTDKSLGQFYQDFFPIPMRLGAAQDCLYLNAKVLGNDNPYKNPRLTAELSMVFQSMDVAKVDQSKDVVKEIVTLLDEYRNNPDQFDAFPDAEKIALHLNMSVRTLNRKLAQQNTSVRELIAKYRQKVAESWLLESDLSIDIIASRLGYIDSSSFGKAFRRWYQMSPSQYRKQYRR